MSFNLVALGANPNKYAIREANLINWTEIKAKASSIFAGCFSSQVSEPVTDAQAYNFFAAQDLDDEDSTSCALCLKVNFCKNQVIPK